jgi:hypothetical protein
MVEVKQFFNDCLKNAVRHNLCFELIFAVWEKLFSHSRRRNDSLLSSFSLHNMAFVSEWNIYVDISHTHISIAVLAEQFDEHRCMKVFRFVSSRQWVESTRLTRTERDKNQVNRSRIRFVSLSRSVSDSTRIR